MENVEVVLENHEQRIKSLQHQVDSIRDDIAIIHDLQSNVSVISATTARTEKTVDEISTRITALEAAPYSELKDYKGTLIKALITGVIGVIIGAVMALVIK